MKAEESDIITPTLAGLDFKFFPAPKGELPSNCPPIRKKDGSLLTDKHALKSFDVLGFYPAYKWMLWGMRDNKNFDWKRSWETQCKVPGGDPTIDVPELIKSLDKMQKMELGELSTGATDMLGIVAQKAVRDAKRAINAGDEKKKVENLKIVARSMDKITDYIDYINKGMKNNAFPASKTGVDACTGNRKENCVDSKARAYLALTRITTAAIDSGFTSAMPNRDLVEKRMPRGKQGIEVASPLLMFQSAVTKPVPSADPEDVVIDPDQVFKVGSDALYQCVITEADDSIPRDQCIEGIKDVAVAGIINQKENVINDALGNLGSWYSVTKTKEGEKLDNLASWVNSTVWMADGLIDVLDAERKGLIPEVHVALASPRAMSRSPKPPAEAPASGVEKLIDTIAAQKKEDKNEFSTADWISQQVLIHTAKKGNVNHHDEIIDKINSNRLLYWNQWLSDYLGAKPFEKCGDDAANCMSEKAVKSLITLSSGLISNCLHPVMKEKKEAISKGKKEEEAIPAKDKGSVKVCAQSLGTIIDKAGNDKLLREATEAWFLYGQEDGGVVYDKEIGNILQDAISSRFTPRFVRSMKGIPDPSNPSKRQPAKTFKTITEPDGWTKEYIATDLFSGRFFKKDPKTNKPIFENYLIELATKGDRVKSSIVRLEME
jgi:hypothetical protein